MRCVRLKEQLPVIMLLLLNLGVVPSCLAESSNAPAAQANAEPIAIYKAAGINGVQEDKIKGQIDEFEKLTLAKGEVMVRLMKELRLLSLQPTPDTKAVISKQVEINTLNNQMSLERINLLLKLRAVLTPEQRVKLVQLMQQTTNSAAKSK